MLIHWLFESGHRAESQYHVGTGLLAG